MGYFDETRAKLLAEYKATATAGTSKEWNEMDERTNPRDNTFDKSWSAGTLPAWIRRRGHVSDEMTGGEEQYDEPNLLGYQNRPASEEPYVDALSDFFADRISRWPGTAQQKEWLHSIMHDRRSTRDIATAEGYSTHSTVVNGRARAIESFVKWAGGKEALAEALRQYLVDREAQDARDRLKYLPRWVHG